jgi:hypothetical protein
MRRAAVIAIVLFASQTALAQRPDANDARTASERSAYSKAQCVFDAVTEAARVFTSDKVGKEPIPPAVQARAKQQSDAFSVVARRGVRECLSEQEVYELGRYSWLEDTAFADGSGCHVRKAPAARFGRTPNNSDGGLVNGAVHWAEVTVPLEAHPFFGGQSEAREEYRHAKISVCRSIVEEYGPSGTRMPGLVQLP